MRSSFPPLKRIETLNIIPALPHILLKLIEACNKDQVSPREISSIVEESLFLADNILSVVNSPYYGLSHKVENIEQAFATVGVHGVRNIGICASVFEAFEGMNGNEIFNPKHFWWHSLKCAALARLIAKKFHYGQPDDAFLSGLLHDIGKLVLWANFPKQYAEILECYKDRHASLKALEIQFGASHPEIGAWLIQHWNLPWFMADAVRYHHEPKGRVSSALTLVRIVYVANALSQPPPTSQAEYIRFAEEIFGVTPNEVDELLTLSNAELKETARSFGIEIEAPGGLEIQYSGKNINIPKNLAPEVRNSLLLLGAFQNLLGAADQNEILQVAKQCFQILFDVKTVFFFLYDPGKDSLIGKISTEKNKFTVIEELFLPLTMENSLLIQSLHQRTPLNSFAFEIGFALVISDEQIIRFIGKEGVLCLPMVTYEENVGVIVLGLDEIEFSHLQRQMKLLTLFTGYVALSLNADRSSRTRFQEIQTERLTAYTVMARKVFHEVNNPLSIIKNYLKILGVKLSEIKIAQDEIRIINEEIDRIALILREISAFSEETVSKNESVDVNLLISDLAKIIKNSLLKNSMITLHLELEPSVPRIGAEKNRLKQVFINLIKNAGEAMTGGGNLYIQTHHIQKLTGKTAADSLGIQDREYVEITVSDDGPGIPDHIKPRLFEPFVSSKSSGHSGLGLSIVYNIIQSFNGKITCESNIGNGTRFSIELSAHESQKI